MAILTIPDEGVYTVQLHRKELRGANPAKDAPEVAKIVRGVLKYEDGSKYEGELVAGMRQGKGKQCYGAPSWDEYEGDWLQDMKHGKGTYRKGPHGRAGTYEGEWLRDLPHGRGREVFPATAQAPQATYEGQYYNGKMQGLGTFVWSFSTSETPEEHWYRGNFREDMRHGLGCLYLGIENHKEHGVEVRAPTNIFVGYWDKGKRQGPAKLIYLHRGDGKGPGFVDCDFNGDEPVGGAKPEVRVNEGHPMLGLINLKLSDQQLAQVAQAVFTTPN
eukprot:TRINITY_DN51124_c0_g1_i1.p1 TRINITY_DN51124_c0_g1~~TRINITY_DN51124_c0_g1_i1.p1  ORF type:complete len:274 (+),score=52.97 TRINITY_DN51124_c0_g1_i1:82-903(+)